MAFDCIVVGGSYSGLAAALQLARARRKVLVIDGGQRRNRFASESHGFLGQDGRAPGAIVSDGRAQLLAYPNVTWIDGQAASAERAGDGFGVATADSTVHRARRLVLATGVVDRLPEVPGLAERWGRSVFHCPYCHGYELGGGEIGVLAISALSMHHALMAPDWGRTTFFLNDAFAPDSEQIAQLERRGVAIERTPVAEIRGEKAEVVLSDGRVFALEGLLTATRVEMASPLAAQLGCAFEETPMGDIVTTDMTKETSVAGVFACGDAARAAGSIALAVGDGTMAGAAAHRSMFMREDNATAA
ncbi:NAD(P)/FAD-dependent oxidoreductase [Pelagibacterium xiamenense]|uniref:NAD(P)/FAD-dependent oxidoreductase n=1 Tax=Pelagibacterium xiamenense TaxID=2901140 RepID=UPI001E3341D9|nr:NAD(P)/FAD-dependent oxidoreductase [Pelagibacterium xiamenense]MCD7060263.1 NAD(P)/FAD-dependent oxidoreductase [Pelagibacterium xiamenense]